MSQLFDTLKKAKSELEVKLREQGKKAFEEHLKDFFEANPQVDVIRWRQYTPYFNDGDACHFGYYELYYRGKTIKNKYKPEQSDYGDDFMSIYGIEDNAVKKALVALDKDLSSMEGALEIAFGDHVMVTASREGIQTDTYEHD